MSAVEYASKVASISECGRYRCEQLARLARDCLPAARWARVRLAKNYGAGDSATLWLHPADVALLEMTGPPGYSGLWLHTLAVKLTHDPRRFVACYTANGLEYARREIDPVESMRPPHV